MNFEKFLNIIWKQDAAGYDGFEGLIAKLLERLTGQRFHLSRTGDQGGRDMASNYLMVECKKHLDSTDFKRDELLAKFSAAAQNSLKPDLWMVVTTKRLSDQHHNPLRKFSKDSGITYFSIDTQGKEKSFLAALCAYAPEITVRHLQESCEKLKEDKKYFSTRSEADEFACSLKIEFAPYLQSLKENKEVSDKAEKLKQELSAQNIGYDHWRDTQNAWLCKRLRNKDESRAAFSQNIAVRADGELLIPRKAAQEALDNWFANWHEQRNFFVVLGEEGDGKTWAVADWLYDKLSDGFPVIFLPSGMADCKEPDILLSEIITNQLRQPYDGYWQKRLQRWLERPAGDTPLFLLVMDGLNERPDMEWRQLLAKFVVEPWCNHVAVLMTCRNNFWQEKMEAGEDVTRFQLLPYNDAELNQAIAANGLTLAKFHENIIDILRVPRYFDLAVRLQQNISSEGDITRDRLIYEDWRDRVGRKFDNSLMSDKEFQDMISDLSRSKIERGNLSRKDVTDKLSPYGEHYKLMKQLESEGIIKWDNGSCEINHKHLTLGLGLLLARETFNAAKFGKDIEETIARCQEPQPDMDLKVSICAMALYHALGEKDWPEEIHLALFNAWVFGRNIKEDDWWRITSYLPVRPEIYLRMMEQEWSGNADNMGLQNVFKKRFLQFGAQDNVRQALVPAFERWMGFVHSAGYGSLFNDEKSLEEGRKYVQDSLGGTFSGKLFGCNLNMIEDEELLRLSLFALTIISNQPRTPYISAIVTCVVSNVVMGRPDLYEQLSWLLRTTAKNDVEGFLLPEAERLLQYPESAAQKAAWRLLNSLSTEKAWQLRDGIPSEYHEIPYKEDHCRRLFSEENYLNCIEKLWDEPELIVSHLRIVALNHACGVPDNLFSSFMNVFREVPLEKIKSASDGGDNGEDRQLSNLEPALCAYYPERFAEIINELARQLPERSGMGRQSLSRLIYKHILILDETSRAAVDRAWRSSLANAEDENSRVAEKVLFPCVLRGRTLDQQLDFLEERGEKCGWWQSYAPFLQDIDNPAKAVLLRKKLKNISSAEQLHNFLSVVASSVEIELDDQTMSLMPDFSKIDDNMLRADILEIIFRSKNQKAIHSFLNCDWSSENAARDDERHWGSYLLAEYGRELPFSEISRRVSVDILGYAVKKRGCKPEEIAVYGEILNRNMPDNYVQTDVLAEVIALHPEYIKKWLQDASRLILTRQFFCESLCRVLLDKQPEQGRQLFWKFRRNNRHKTQTDSLFNANDSTEVFDLRKNLLNNVLTDNDLFEIAFLAQKHDRLEWLEEAITTYLDSDFALDNAKGLFLLGFMDVHSAGERLDAWITEKQPSWLRNCAEQAKRIHERNQWAHHWFERFVTHDETLQAWAAFRLFLRCVDRRFWLWGTEMIYSPDVPYERFEHYRACRESIVKAIKENEEKSPFELKKHLVGWKVQENQLWPWLRAYLPEEDAQA